MNCHEGRVITRIERSEVRRNGSFVDVMIFAHGISAWLI